MKLAANGSGRELVESGNFIGKPGGVDRSSPLCFHPLVSRIVMGWAYNLDTFNFRG